MPRPTRPAHGAPGWDDYLESVFDDLYAGVGVAPTNVIGDIQIGNIQVNDVTAYNGIQRDDGTVLGHFRVLTAVGQLPAGQFVWHDVGLQNDSVLPTYDAGTLTFNGATGDLCLNNCYLTVVSLTDPDSWIQVLPSSARVAVPAAGTRVRPCDDVFASGSATNFTLVTGNKVLADTADLVAVTLQIGIDLYYG